MEGSLLTKINQATWTITLPWVGATLTLCSGPGPATNWPEVWLRQSPTRWPEQGARWRNSSGWSLDHFHDLWITFMIFGSLSWDHKISRWLIKSLLLRFRGMHTRRSYRATFEAYGSLFKVCFKGSNLKVFGLKPFKLMSHKESAGLHNSQQDAMTPWGHPYVWRAG